MTKVGPVHFERARVISLARRQDRRAEMDSRWSGLLELDYFDAVDGSALDIPPWWRESAGAYGCYLSHLALLEESEGATFILEDDAVPSTLLAPVLSRPLPDEGWDLLYFGGQHSPLSKRVRHFSTPRLVEAEHVSRTHAYAVRDPHQVAQLLRQELRRGVHVDEVLAYCGLRQVVWLPFLVGQGSGRSDIWDEERSGHEFWN